tara:strand:- start:1772 stop:2020 length:249 start_codon:yes stop_codon:yes gene_type:complete
MPSFLSTVSTGSKKLSYHTEAFLYLRFQQAQNRRVLHNALPYVGLCRVEFDPRPHFIEDRIRLQLANLNARWRDHPDAGSLY